MCTGIDPLIFNFAKRRRWVVSFTPLPLYPWHPLHRGLGGPKPVWMLWRREKYPSCKVIAHGTKIILSHVECHCPFVALYWNLQGGAPLVTWSAKFLRAVRKISTRFTNPVVCESHLLPLPRAWIMLTEWTSVSFGYQRLSDSLFSNKGLIFRMWTWPNWIMTCDSYVWWLTIPSHQYRNVRMKCIREASGRKSQPAHPLSWWLRFYVFYSVSPGKCNNDIFKQATISSFHILSNSLFTIAQSLNALYSQLPTESLNKLQIKGNRYRHSPRFNILWCSIPSNIDEMPNAVV
jgi:hypothetical protein